MVSAHHDQQLWSARVVAASSSKAESGSASEQKTEHVDVEELVELMALDRGSTQGGMHQEQINPVVVPGTETGRQSASLPRRHVAVFYLLDTLRSIVAG